MDDDDDGDNISRTLCVWPACTRRSLVMHLRHIHRASSLACFSHSCLPEHHTGSVGREGEGRGRDKITGSVREVTGLHLELGEMMVLLLMMT
jgi:hypothetical protein